MAEEAWIEAMPGEGGFAFAAGGNWLVSTASVLDRQLDAIESGVGARPSGRPSKGPQGALIDCSKLEALDTVGAWLMLRLKAALRRGGAEVSLDNLAERFAPLLAQAEKYQPQEDGVAAPRSMFGPIDGLAALGAWAVEQARGTRNGLGFVGEVTIAALHTLRSPRRLRPMAYLSHVQRTGPAALPIIGLLSFLIGVVFAYQGAAQLQQFGAEIFTVNLLTIGFELWKLLIFSAP